MDYIIRDEPQNKEVRFSRLEDVGKIVIEIIDQEIDDVYGQHIEINEEEFARLFTLFDFSSSRGVTDHDKGLVSNDKQS